MKDNKAIQVLDTVEFHHHHLTQPTLTHVDIILHGINTLSCSLKYAPTITFDIRLRAITKLRDLFKRWADPSQLATFPTRPKPKIKYRGNWRKTHIPPTPKTRIPLTPPPPRVLKPTTASQSPRGDFSGVMAPTPRVETSSPRVETSQPHQESMSEPVSQSTRLHQSPPLPMSTEPITQYTRSHTANIVSLAHASGRRYQREFLLVGRPVPIGHISDETQTKN